MARRSRKLPSNVVHLDEHRLGAATAAGHALWKSPRAVIEFSAWRDQLRPPPQRKQTILELLNSVLESAMKREEAGGDPPAA